MFRKTAIALGLSMAAGTGFAADGSAAGINIGINSEMPVAAQFNVLDRNGDGAISRIEAQASPELSAVYGSFNTSETIEDEARQPGINGITRAQFRAGLEALGEGVVGPAASGGGTYILMEDGSKVRRDELLQDPVRDY